MAPKLVSTQAGSLVQACLLACAAKPPPSRCRPVAYYGGADALTAAGPRGIHTRFHFHRRTSAGTCTWFILLRCERKLKHIFFRIVAKNKLHARSSHHEGRKPADMVDWRRTVQGRFFYAAMSALNKLVSCSPVEPQIVQPGLGKRTHSKVKP